MRAAPWTSPPEAFGEESKVFIVGHENPAFQFLQDAAACIRPDSTADTVTGSGAVCWSGYRLRKWSRDGQQNGDKTLTAAGDVVKTNEGGGMLIDDRVWTRLKTTLGKAKEDNRTNQAEGGRKFELIDPHIVRCHRYGQNCDVLAIKRGLEESLNNRNMHLYEKSDYIHAKQDDLTASLEGPLKETSHEFGSTFAFQRTVSEGGV